MMLHIRNAGAMDASAMADLLNEIIAIGGTTAITESVVADDMLRRMNSAPEHSSWLLAEDDQGRLMGFQWITPDPDHGPDAAEIATFARVGQTGTGIGSKLFSATSKAAKKLGYKYIIATIRADNEGGLIYYRSRGFEDYSSLKDCLLDNGQIVDKIVKRYEV